MMRCELDGRLGVSLLEVVCQRYHSTSHQSDPGGHHPTCCLLLLLRVAVVGSSY